MLNNILVHEKRCNTNNISRALNTSAIAQARATEVEKLENNPYLDKYRAKLEKMKHENPALYFEKLLALSEKSPPATTTPGATASGNVETTKPVVKAPVKNKARSISESKETSQNGPEASLNDIVKLDLLQDLNKDDITRIWRDYHSNKNYICAVVPPEIFSVQSALLRKYPQFIYALPKEQGFEFIYCQSQFNNLYFTGLGDYQTHLENAPVILSVNHFPELMDEKGIVLMRGEYDGDRISPQEAQTLMNQFQLFYSDKKPQHTKFVQTFNEKPAEFDYKELLSVVSSLVNSIEK